MGERRMGDRRAPEKGVIRINLKNAIIYLILIMLLIISLSLNIVLLIKNREYKKTIDIYSDATFLNEEFDDYDDFEDEFEYDIQEDID